MHELHFKPQYEYICNNNGKLITNYLGRFEALDESYREIISKLNLPYEPLKQKNINTSRNSYQDYYTPETAEIVRQVYHKDIELLGYKF